MWVGGTQLHKALQQMQGFSEAQAYLLTELAYSSNGSMLISDTYSRITTMRNLQKRGLIEPEIEGLVIKLTDEGRALIGTIHPIGFSWQHVEP